MAVTVKERYKECSPNQYIFRAQLLISSGGVCQGDQVLLPLLGYSVASIEKVSDEIYTTACSHNQESESYTEKVQNVHWVYITKRGGSHIFYALYKGRSVCDGML